MSATQKRRLQDDPLGDIERILDAALKSPKPKIQTMGNPGSNHDIWREYRKSLLTIGKGRKR